MALVIAHIAEMSRRKGHLECGYKNLYQQRMAEIMERALDMALDKKDVKRKRARRLAREAKQRSESPKEKPCPGKVLTTSRYIPSAVLKRVHERAGHQCEFRALDGTRCRSRTGHFLEYWKYADPELPELQEAKKYVGR